MNHLISQRRRTVSLGVTLASSLFWLGQPWGAQAAERLDRGVVALRTGEREVYVGWRLLASDPPAAGFDVFRARGPNERGERLNAQPITASCDFSDADAGAGEWHYRVERVGGGTGGEAVGWAQAPGIVRGYLPLRLEGNHRAQKVGWGDFDGDGALDYLVKQPDFNTDPYQQPGYWKKSEGTYRLEAYRHDGRFLWRYDMGWAIEQGIWYSPIVVYDLDGDGCAEVYTKAGEGDPREPTGHVRSGPEYLVKLDGRTGEVVAKLPWPSREGFDDYNYYCRNLLGVAYLDGQRPHLTVVRGTYRIIKVQAYDPSLTLRWAWEAAGEYASYRGQGMHGLHAADVDGDGRDEVILGSAVLDDDGRGLWTTGLGHPDICYVADIDPARPGLEIFYGIEPGGPRNKVCLVDARTGAILWGYQGQTKHVHGQGMVGDIDPSQPGLECYAGEKDGSNYWLYSAAGGRLSDQSLGDLSPKAIYWTAGPSKVYVTGGKLYEYPRKAIGTIEGRVVAIADCLGDWREEVVTSLDGELRIYSTTVPANTRRVCLLQDRLYRTDVAVQTMGYFYPPQLGGTPLAPVAAGVAARP
ncbi:MAG: silent information regulator protein Sir2 [Verrucomicrobia bacterium]|nr:silent information regulator protein Sir2 [Verrucomicrobiota bacterium]